MRGELRPCSKQKVVSLLIYVLNIHTCNAHLSIQLNPDFLQNFCFTPTTQGGQESLFSLDIQWSRFHTQWLLLEGKASKLAAESLWTCRSRRKCRSNRCSSCRRKQYTWSRVKFLSKINDKTYMPKMRRRGPSVRAWTQEHTGPEAIKSIAWLEWSFLQYNRQSLLTAICVWRTWRSWLSTLCTLAQQTVVVSYTC